MLEDVGDVLVAESIVDGDGGKPVEAGCNVTYGPFLPVLRENAEYLQLLSLGLAEQLLLDDGAADLLRPLQHFLVADKNDAALLLLLDDAAYVSEWVPMAGKLANFLQLLTSTSFMVARLGSGRSTSLSFWAGER